MFPNFRRYNALDARLKTEIMHVPIYMNVYNIISIKCVCVYWININQITRQQFSRYFYQLIAFFFIKMYF